MSTATAAPSPADLLGLRVPERDPLALVRAIEQGLPARALARFKKVTRLADADVARLLRLSGRTVTRIKSATAVRLPADVIARWKSTGPGWQTRMAERLSKER